MSDSKILVRKISVRPVLSGLVLSCLLLAGCAHDYALFREGRDLYGSQEYEKAIEKFETLRQDYPQSNILELSDEYLRLTREAIRRKEKTPEPPAAVQQKAAEEPVRPVQKPEEKPEKLLTNVYYDTELKEVLRNLAAETGENLITDETVQGIISVKYDNLPLERVLKMVLSVGGYSFKRMDGYYLIGSADPRSPLYNILSQTVYVKPTFLRAKEIAKLISPAFVPSIQVNEERNMLTVTASPQVVERILTDIRRIDKMPRQVILEALVVELSSEARRTLGIDFSGQSGKYAGSIQDLDILFNYSSVPFGIRELTARVHALVKDGEASVRARPRVTTMDGEEAKIDITQEQYISLTSGPVTYPYTTIQTIKAGIAMNIQPFISDDNSILVRIHPAEVSDFVETDNQGLPIINRRSVQTTVVVKDNETIAIGGLIKKRELDKISRVPVLGHIPILNLFFSKTEKASEDTEILILITPKILDESSVRLASERRHNAAAAE